MKVIMFILYVTKGKQKDDLQFFKICYFILLLNGNIESLLVPLLQNVLTAVRQTFDVFFLRYPYCYGYWKKYADIEKKHGNYQEAEEVNISVFDTRLFFCLWFLPLTY